MRFEEACTSWLVLAASADPLIEGAEVVRHAAELRGIPLQVTQDVAHLIPAGTVSHKSLACGILFICCSLIN